MLACVPVRFARGYMPRYMPRLHVKGGGKGGEGRLLTTSSVLASVPLHVSSVVCAFLLKCACSPYCSPHINILDYRLYAYTRVEQQS